MATQFDPKALVSAVTLCGTAGTGMTHLTALQMQGLKESPVRIDVLGKRGLMFSSAHTEMWCRVLVLASDPDTIQDVQETLASKPTNHAYFDYRVLQNLLTNCTKKVGVKLGNELVIEHGTGTADLKRLDAKNIDPIWPQFPELTGEPIAIPGAPAALSSAMALTGHTQGSGANYAAMYQGAAQIRVIGHNARISATDGFCGMLHEEALPAEHETLDVRLERNVAKQVSKLDGFSVLQGEKQVVFSGTVAGNHVDMIATRLNIATEYPDIDGFTTGLAGCTMSVKGDDLTKALRCMGPFVAGSNSAMLYLKAGSGFLSIGSVSFNGNCTMTMDAKIELEPDVKEAWMCISHRYLQPAAANFAGKECTVRFMKRTPVLLSGDDSHGRDVYVIMPMVPGSTWVGGSLPLPWWNGDSYEGQLALYKQAQIDLSKAERPIKPLETMPEYTEDPPEVEEGIDFRDAAPDDDDDLDDDDDDWEDDDE